MPGEKTVARSREAIAVPSGVLRTESSSSATVGPDRVLIGRDASCSLFIDDPEVSAIHAEVFVEDRPTGPRIVVRDCDSLNGILVHGVRVREFILAKPTSFLVGATRVDFVPVAPTEVVLSKSEDFHGVLGSDPGMRALHARLQRIAATDLSVLVLGETGTGKEVVAHAIHLASPRASKPFVVVDCASISPALVESTLFGHERGAFTGATDRAISPFIRAAGGTVFLDELGELPLHVQPKLLRALAERTIQSVGGSEYRRFDARIIAATRRNLPIEINDERFRSDLFFRVAETTIELPPLRKRTADIPLLAKKFLEQLGMPDAFDRITEDSFDAAMRHDWPGNVRELKSLVRAAAQLADDGEPIDLFAHRDIPAGDASTASSQTTDDRRYVTWEKAYFANLNKACKGNRSAMARASGLKRDTILKKLRLYAIGDEEASVTRPRPPPH